MNVYRINKVLYWDLSKTSKYLELSASIIKKLIAKGTFHAKKYYLNQQVSWKYIIPYLEIEEYKANTKFRIPEGYIDSETAARILQRSKSTLYSYSKDGLVSHIKRVDLNSKHKTTRAYYPEVELRELSSRINKSHEINTSDKQRNTKDYDKLINN